MSQTSGEHTSVLTAAVDLNMMFWWVVPMSGVSCWMLVAQEEPPAPEGLSLQVLHLVGQKASHCLSACCSMSKILSQAFLLVGVRGNSFVAGKHVHYQPSLLVVGQLPGLRLMPGLAAKLVSCLFNIHIIGSPAGHVAYRSLWSDIDNASHSSSSHRKGIIAALCRLHVRRQDRESGLEDAASLRSTVIDPHDSCG